ncbi:hypothetical protein [Cytobacillus oceanisediminis]|uniref:hypothetical protein n=1 Tax=Cytobacillus oceanisediminis TaxID=665099 RepID=UPI001FB27CCB|nr:hypothetical protein [Cytobacillus oceanisediminis]UOE58066.1 hypothetical protein IRB79_27775 [Cytobacillus oceanisediminis]
MELKPHKDHIRDSIRNRGYAIRIGQKVPKNSANLAYVQAKPISPEENILLEDVSSHIAENGLSSFIEKDYLVYPNKDYMLETEAGQSIFPTDAVSITDEFTIRKNRQDIPSPVFYRMELNGRFDVRTAQVLPYSGGFSIESEQDAKAFEEIVPERRQELVFVGNSIRVEANGGPLNEGDVYKVQLIREENFVYRIVLFTNFLNKNNLTYKVIYPHYRSDIQQTEVREEVLKAYPFFSRVTPDEFRETIDEMEANPDQYKHLKIYTADEDNNDFVFYATSDVMIANYQTRRPQQFKHRVEAKLKTKLSETNPGKLYIGFHFVQEAQGVENLASIGKALNESILLPSYVELINPHTPEPDLLKRDIRYWMADLDMPEHHYEDYDVLVITGYGKTDLSMHKDKLQHFLQNGGTLIVDNAGSGIKVLDFNTSKGNSFLFDISFSNSTNEFGIKEFPAASPYSNRLYSITSMANLGYPGTSPAIIFGQNEEAAQWQQIVKHINGGASLVKKTVFGKGTILVSNSGLFRSLYHNQQESLSLILNAILHHAEEQWVLTPWRNDFVYHRDNLFAQEYKVNNNDVYINDRSDYDSNQIVAKKILAPNIKDYVKVYAKPWFYNAVGSFEHAVDGNRVFPINNGDFEAGSVDAQGVPLKEWSASTTNAIPSWNTKKLAGQTVLFSHDSESTLFGVRTITLNSTNGDVGAHAFWESESIYFPVDDYKVSAWLTTENVRGITTDGAKIGIYNLAGEKIAASIGVIGKKNGIKIDISFRMDKPQTIKIRLGFADGNGFGKITFDNVAVETVGAVKGVPFNEGEKALYAYSTKPNSSTIDIEAEGFDSANITRISPAISFSYTIVPFIYEKLILGMDSTTGMEYSRYERRYGTPVSYDVTVSKKEGLKNLGYLHSLLPGIPSGREWYDKNKVFYKIALGDFDDGENTLVNLKLFDRKTGIEWYHSKELIIGYKDIFWATDKPSFVLHAETGFETIRASKRNFGLQLMDDRKMYVETPQTKDAKENWYARIHNGHFTKDGLSYKEWSELYSYQDPSVMEKYKERFLKKEKYSIKEYDSQIFNPSIGIMTVEKEMEYLTPNTVKVPHHNLFVKKGEVIKEELIVEGLAESEGTLFRARETHWVRGTVHLYLDEQHNGNAIEIFEEFPYEVNHEEGTVFFPGQIVTGKIYASYSHRNFRLYKRLYKNGRVSNDLLRNKRMDSKTKEVILYGSKVNWMIQPVPVLKTTTGKATNNNIIPATSYRLDYETGAVIFKYDPVGPVYADYGYFDDQELTVKDYDIQNGIFLLNENVSFKDSLFAKYAYFEDFYDYKGYYNGQFETFFHLDLNPSVGHYSTLPMTTYVNGEEKVEYKKVPSAKLLNKSIHIYIVPESEGGYSIRHCFSSEEWRNLQKSNPMYLLLAKVQVREHTNVNEVVVMDARVRGGGITGKMSGKKIDERVKGKQRYWDIGNWDGKAFYRNGVLIVTLPKSILINYGGTLSEEHVRESIDKHVAYGTYCIIEWE